MNFNIKKYYLNLFNYNGWANRQLLTALKSSGYEIDSELKLMSHIISTQDLWLERLNKTPNYLMDIWETFSIQEIEVLLNNSSANWQKFIKRQNRNSFDNKLCIYKNSEGKEFTNLQVDIMQHVITHSNYHRGQINFLLRKLELRPVKTDFINFVREKD